MVDLTSLPQPVARPLQIAIGGDAGASLQARVWAVPFTAYQALRVACLPVIEAYLDAPIETDAMPSQGSVASIANALERLQCPFFADWVTALETLAKHVKPQTVGQEPALPLASAVAALKEKQWPVLDESFADKGTGALPAHRLILALRNRLAHGGNLSDDRECRRILDHYVPALWGLLEALSFLSDCELRVREGDWDGEYTRVHLLRGPEPAGAQELQELGDADEWEPALTQSAVALRVPDRRVLPMSPLFTVGAQSPVGLYDGHFILEAAGAGRGGSTVRQRHVYYLGSGHDRWADPDAIDMLVDRLSRRCVQWRVSKEKLAPWTIVDTLRDGTVAALGDLLGRKYFPECHVDREDMQREFQAFLTADDPSPGAHWGPSTPVGRPAARVSGLVLAGAAGTGKTAWCCRVVEHLLAEGTRRDAREDQSREGRNLVLFLRGDMVPARAGRQDRLLATILERMGLRDGDFASFDDLFSHLDRKVRQDRIPGRRLVFVLDALNEVAVDPEGCFREALDLVRSAARHPWVKVLITIREEFLGVLHGKAGGQEKRVFFGSEPCLYVRRDQERGHPGSRAPVVVLHPLTMDEAREAYRRYHGRGLVDRPGCRTPWERLDETTRGLLRNPLMLYVFHRRFSGREAEVLRGQEDLFRGYVEGLMEEYPALQDACRRAMDRLLEKTATELTPADAEDLRRTWAQGRTPDEARLGMSPVETLLHAGLLRERSRHEGAGFVFVFESVLEFLLYDAWGSRQPDLPLDFLLELVEQGILDDWPDTFWNAFGYVFERLLDEGRASDWPALVNDESPPALDSVAARVWVAFAAMCGLPSDAGRERLAETAPGKVIEAYATTGESWAADRLWQLGSLADDMALPEWAEQAHAAAARLLETLVASGRRELENNLADVYNDLGAALIVRGNLDTAIAVFQKACEIYKRLVLAGQRELKTDLAMVYDNLAAALSELGDQEAAIGALEKSRKIREEVVASGRFESAEDLAGYYNNLAATLADRGDLNAAFEAYQEARSILERLVLSGRRELETDLAMVYSNLGATLNDRGDPETALHLIQSAREIYERLVSSGRRDLEKDLTDVFIRLGEVLSVRRNLDVAVQTYQQAREIYERLVSAGRRELQDELADAFCHLGDALSDQRDLARAIEMYQMATQIYGRLVAGGRRELEKDLAGTCFNLGIALSECGALDGAIEAYQKSREIRERLVSSGRRELEKDLADAHVSLGDALAEREDLDAAIEAYQKARGIYERLFSSGRRDLEKDLADVHSKIGDALYLRDDLDEAIDAYEKAREIYERLVSAGRRELEEDLADAHYGLGNALAEREDLGAAIEAYQKAREIHERLVSAGRQDLESNLAVVHSVIGAALRERGDLDEAIDAYEKAL